MNPIIHKRNLTCFILPFLVGVVLSSGCSDGLPDRVPIAGQVLIDGAPLEGAFVKFVPAEGRPAIGETDSNGRFTLTCYKLNDGATRGNHQVAVIAVKELGGTAIMWRAPKKYSDSRSSGIEFVVEEPKDDLLLQLTWDGGKPYIEREKGSNGVASRE